MKKLSECIDDYLRALRAGDLEKRIAEEHDGRRCRLCGGRRYPDGSCDGGC